MSDLSHPDQPGALATLDFVDGPRAGEHIAIESPTLSIGKGAQNEIVLEDDSVSTRHAQLQYDTGAWRITDLDSTNGTYVDGTRLAPKVPTPLHFGASIRLGGVNLQLLPVEGADPEAARSEPAAAAAAPTEQGPGGFRLPVWALVLAVILLLLAILIFRWTSAPASDLPVPEAIAVLLDLPAEAKCL